MKVTRPSHSQNGAASPRQIGLALMFPIAILLLVVILFVDQGSAEGVRTSTGTAPGPVASQKDQKTDHSNGYCRLWLDGYPSNVTKNQILLKLIDCKLDPEALKNYPEGAHAKCSSLQYPSPGDQCKTNEGNAFERLRDKNGKSGWLDPKSELIWFDDEPEKTHKDAKAACEAVGARLPTEDEMKGAIEHNFFETYPLPMGAYWIDPQISDTEATLGIIARLPGQKMEPSDKSELLHFRKALQAKKSSSRCVIGPFTESKKKAMREVKNNPPAVSSQPPTQSPPAASNQTQTPATGSGPSETQTPNATRDPVTLEILNEVKAMRKEIDALKKAAQSQSKSPPPEKKQGTGNSPPIEKRVLCQFSDGYHEGTIKEQFGQILTVLLDGAKRTEKINQQWCIRRVR